jgi:ATP-dependent Lon protease
MVTVKEAQEGDTGVLFRVLARLTKGSGKLHVLGGLDPEAQDSFRVAAAFVSIHARALQGWLTVARQPLPLLTKAIDVDVGIDEVDSPTMGPSGGTAAALALTVMLTRCKLVSHDVALTGGLDLRGRIRVVGGLLEKITHCQEQGVDLLLVPALSMQAHNRPVLAPEVEEYAGRAVKPVESFIDILEHSVQGASVYDVRSCARARAFAYQ